MIFRIKNQLVLIDDEDWLELKDHTWFLGGGHSGEDYVMGHLPEGLSYMHRVIMKPGPGLLVDHRNRNRYDNRRENLRNVDFLTSNLNRGLNGNNTSGVKGVSWHRVRAKWRAHIMVNRKQIHLGLFDVFEDAITARQLAEQKYWATYLQEVA